MQVNHAKGFTVEYYPNYKKVTVNNPWQQGKLLAVYYLVRTNDITIPSDGQKLTIPLKSIAITSCTHIEPLNVIGEITSISGICSPELIYNDYITDSFYQKKITNLGDAFNINFESLLMLAPDALMLASYSQQDESIKRLNNAGIPIIFNNEWTENTLLARAEWIKYIAAFYDKETLADSIFQIIEADYETAKALVNDIDKPSVLAGGNFKGTWYMPGGESYMAHLFADAGCSYFYSTDSTTTSIPLNFENVLYNFDDAEIWLNAPAATMKELINSDERHNLFRAAKTGNVYGFYGRTKSENANDFWESAVTHPDIVLKDVIWAVHPELLSDYKPMYIIKLK
jgi:iron complex transport system substrate-binding protein